jgi:hypothetical protein
MNTRDRRQTPTCASLTVGWYEAVDREATEVKPDTASAFYLNGEGTSENLKSKDVKKIKSKDTARIISNNNSKM